MPRASWRGYLRLSLVSCPVYLLPAMVRTNPSVFTKFGGRPQRSKRPLCRNRTEDKTPATDPRRGYLRLRRGSGGTSRACN